MPIRFGIVSSHENPRSRRCLRHEIEPDELYITDDFSKGAIRLDGIPVVFDIRCINLKEKRQRVSAHDHRGASFVSASLLCSVEKESWDGFLSYTKAKMPEIASWSEIVLCPYLQIEASRQRAHPPSVVARGDLSDFRLPNSCNPTSGSYVSVSLERFWSPAEFTWPVNVSWPSGRLDYPTIEFSNGSNAAINTARDDCNKSFRIEREHRGTRLFYHRTTRLLYNRDNSMLYRRIEQQLREQFPDKKFTKACVTLTTVYEGDASNTYSIPAKLVLDAAA